VVAGFLFFFLFFFFFLPKRGRRSAVYFLVREAFILTVIRTAVPLYPTRLFPLLCPCFHSFVFTDLPLAAVLCFFLFRSEGNRSFPLEFSLLKILGQAVVIVLPLLGIAPVVK